MIEIGSERTFGYAARRVGSAFGTAAVLLLLIWLVRGLLSISSYSSTILLVAFGFIFLGRALHTRTSAGVGRAVASFLGNLTLACVTTLISIWFLAWVAQIQTDVFPTAIYSQVPNLVITGIALGLASIVFTTVSPRQRGLRTTGPALLIHNTSTVSLDPAKLWSKADTVALPIKRSRRTIGAVIVGDVNATFQTPMGVVAATIPGPVTTIGVPFRGEKVRNEDVSRTTGKSLNDLVESTPVNTSAQEVDSEVQVDLPFIHVRRDAFEDSVDVGPLSVKSGPEGDSVRLGPLTIDSDSDDDWTDSICGDSRRALWNGSGWLVRGPRDTQYISSTERGLTARWNGSILKLKGDVMNLRVGSDGFTYSPSDIETFSPLHTLRVTKDKVTLNTKKFALNVSGGRVLLRTEGGSKSTDSGELAKDLRTLLADMAKKHVADVMEGEPIELDEMLNGTEELLKKYE